MCMCNQLNIKTINKMHGLRDVCVDPESCISCLRIIEGNNCVFIYKNTLLVESMTFSFYSMNDGDVICAIPPYQDLVTTYQLFQDKNIVELEKERLKILDQKLKRVDGDIKAHKKFINLKMNMFKYFDFDINHSECYTRVPLFPPQQPSSKPLPSFW